ncbi:MAG: shikimate kinase [Parachlamydiaceae bacterium]
MNVVLCGMGGCGKTTIGQKISEKFSVPFLDTDRLIENAYANKGQKLTCREIYIKEGAEKFRQFEKEQILNLESEGTWVLATGGGTFDDPENVAALKKYGTIVFLKCSLEVLWDRMQRTGMPAYLDKSDSYHAFMKLLLIRSHYYEKAANGIVNCHQLTPEEIVWEVMNLVPFLKSPLGANLTGRP